MLRTDAPRGVSYMYIALVSNVNPHGDKHPPPSFCNIPTLQRNHCIFG